MKLTITEFTNRTDIVLVEGEKEATIIHPDDSKTEFKKGKEIEFETAVAKVFFGDWHKVGDYHEEARKAMLGISGFEYLVKTKEFVIHGKTEISPEEQLFVEPEKEFAGLNKLNQKTCKGIAKTSGKPCTRAVLDDDSDFCPQHKDQAKEV